jgi:hypothetical protein
MRYLQLIIPGPSAGPDPTKPAEPNTELARIDAKLSEPGRMKALQAM